MRNGHNEHNEMMMANYSELQVRNNNGEWINTGCSDEPLAPALNGRKARVATSYIDEHCRQHISYRYSKVAVQQYLDTFRSTWGWMFA